MKKTKNIALKKNTETDLEPVLYPLVLKYKYFNFCSFQMSSVLF